MSSETFLIQILNSEKKRVYILYVVLKKSRVPHDNILQNVHASIEEVKNFYIEGSQRKVANSRQHEQKMYI